MSERILLDNPLRGFSKETAPSQLVHCMRETEREIWFGKGYKRGPSANVAASSPESLQRDESSSCSLFSAMD